VGNCAEGANARREIAAKVLIMVHPNKFLVLIMVFLIGRSIESCKKSRTSVL
jgi:hypothetical protein